MVLFGTVSVLRKREREGEAKRGKERRNAVQCCFGAVRCCSVLSGAIRCCSGLFGGYSTLSGAVRRRSARREREGARDREELMTRQRPPTLIGAMRPPGEGGAGDC